MRKTLAVLFDYLEGDYQAGLRTAIEDAGRAHDVNILLVVGRPLDAPIPSEAAQNDVYRRLLGAPIDGIIVAAASLGAYSGLPGLMHLMSMFRHLACCSVSMEIPQIPSLVVDNWGGSRALVDHLIEAHGCRRIAYIRGPENSSEAIDRYDAYRDSLEAHGLPFDPKLLEKGDFWIDHGASAMHRLLDSGCAIDSVVGANDHMAFGAMSVLRARRICVPDEVLVAGFDDSPTSLVASPSMTTARQPVSEMGRMAVETILDQLAGRSIAMVRRLAVEIVLRQSCGCAYHLERRTLAAPTALQPAGSPVGDVSKLRTRMLKCVTGPPDALGPWADQLLDALQDELSGNSGRFLRQLEDLLDRAQVRYECLHEFNDVIAVFRRHVHSVDGNSPSLASLEELWHEAILLVGTATTRGHARERFRVERAHESLRRTIERLSTALDRAALSNVLADLLPGVDVHRAAISVYEQDNHDTLHPLVMLDCSKESQASEERILMAQPFPSSMLAPAGFFPSDRRWSDLVLPLTFGSEQLGIAVFESGQHIAIYAMLREQIGAVIKAGVLHRAVVRETAARERAEQDELEKELIIAREIQTAILPATTNVLGLELAGLMLPAAESGGDYFDVLPTEDGCWMAIGDVAGHGLAAGITMLMIQSMVSSLVRSGAAKTPIAVFEGVNAALWDNVRHRLKRDEYATFTIIKYLRSGKLTCAGRHEDILIWRAQARRWEVIETKGVWLCAIENVKGKTFELELSLQDGDLIVLYTDGVTEAMNLQHEHFGSQGLCSLIDRVRDDPVDRICRAIFLAVNEWAPVQADDLSIVVGRYSAS